MDPGVVVVHNLPKDFAERELKEYFEQFGAVNRLRTRGTRGYAYVEFQYKDVAEIAAQSMDNYIMFGRVLKCQLLPKDKVNNRIFNGTQNQITTVARHKSMVNTAKTSTNLDNMMKRRRKMLRASLERLTRFGIQFEPVVINCSDMQNLDVPIVDSGPELKAKLKKLKVKTGMNESQSENSMKPEALPLETITLKAKKRIVRKRLRTVS